MDSNSYKDIDKTMRISEKTVEVVRCYHNSGNVSETIPKKLWQDCHITQGMDLIVKTDGRRIIYEGQVATTPTVKRPAANRLGKTEAFV